MSRHIKDIEAVQHVTRFRTDLWNRHLRAIEQERPLTHEERIRDARACKDIHNHQFWPPEVVKAIAGKDSQKAA